MTITPPLQYSSMHLDHIWCLWSVFHPSIAIQLVLEGPGNHSRGAILSYFNPTLTSENLVVIKYSRKNYSPEMLVGEGLDI